MLYPYSAKRLHAVEQRQPLSVVLGNAWSAAARTASNCSAGFKPGAGVSVLPASGKAYSESDPAKLIVGIWKSVNTHRPTLKRPLSPHQSPQEFKPGSVGMDLRRVLQPKLARNPGVNA